VKDDEISLPFHLLTVPCNKAFSIFCYVSKTYSGIKGFEPVGFLARCLLSEYRRSGPVNLGIGAVAVDYRGVGVFFCRTAHELIACIAIKMKVNLALIFPMSV
jgi:hypothetical protein